jgi:hypothetical protein
MKSPPLLKLVLTLTLACGALAPATNIFRGFSTNAQSVSVTPANHSDRPTGDLPVTDRIPWLIYVVLTSAVVALAWILFSLARNSRKELQPADQSDAETNG